jgi:tRNA(fMet)-specific endonuclease VapC
MKKTGSSPIALDTNIIIDLFQGQVEIADKITKSKAVYIPIPVLGELYLGAENSSRKLHHIRQIEALLKVITLLNTSERTAEVYSKIKARLKEKGTPIPENDIWIAALAKEHDLPVVTRDKHFSNIPDLETLSW